LTRYFEDFTAGESIELGSRTITEDEIIAFARQYDPQPFHLDREAAKQSIFGGLVASGWHTAGLFMRMLVDSVISRSHGMGSPGLEQLSWPAPLRPGDTMTGRISVLETRSSRSRPEMGIVRWHGEAFNQRGELVMTLIAINFFSRRPGST
jgi:acyl dehydratase